MENFDSCDEQCSYIKLLVYYVYSHVNNSQIYYDIRILILLIYMILVSLKQRKVSV
jgi:hypothetical protein